MPTTEPDLSQSASEPPSAVEPSRRRTLPTLRVIAGPDLLRFVTLTPHRQLDVGRDSGTDLSLAHPTVSKVHARISVDAFGQVSVLDLQSTNGTAVNGRRVRRSTLAPGDLLEVGDVPLRLELLTREELNHLARVCERFEAPGRDAETGLSPYRDLQTSLATTVRKAEESSTAMGCLHIHIDQLSSIRRTHGDGRATRVLRSAARIVALKVRASDLCMASEDRDVVVILPGGTPSGSAEVAERIRVAIARHDWVREVPQSIVTTSIGVANYVPPEGAEAWLDRAKRAAHHARACGQNRVERAVYRATNTNPIVPGI